MKGDVALIEKVELYRTEERGTGTARVSRTINIPVRSSVS